MRKLIRDTPKFWNYLTEEQINQMLESEIKHSNRLRINDAFKRKKLYKKVYDDYYSELPFHPAFRLNKDLTSKKNRLDFQLKKLKPVLNKNDIFVEIGAGDCSLSIQVSPFVSKVIAMEIAKSYAKQNSNLPENVEIKIFDGFNFPFQENTIDFFYSNQCMEHLHPEDAIEQLKSIFLCLKDKGKYMCITPNQLLGPGDISGYFGNKPIGFHLKEYTDVELKKILKNVGFKKIRFQTIIKNKSIYIPFFMKWTIEKLFSKISRRKREKLLNYRIINLIFNTVIISEK